jgi:hypothetical protein
MTLKTQQFFLAIALATFSSSAIYAQPYYDTVNIGQTMLQGGNNSLIQWFAPSTRTYKLNVYVPNNSTATNVAYRVYPKGNIVGNTSCLSNHPIAPCFEIPVNQSVNQGKWLTLTVNGKANTAFGFVKEVGFISVSASNLPATETVGASSIRFELPFPLSGYSKISNSGKLLADTAVLGSKANDWACVRDNRTGLYWEVKTDDGGLRDKDNTYTWYNSNPTTNGGLVGTRNGGYCTGEAVCDTEGYQEALNGQRLCGFSDWRVPNIDELFLIVSKIYTPTISPTYFPNTQNTYFWTSSIAGSYPQVVNFIYGNNDYYNANRNYSVRLVRGEP